MIQREVITIVVALLVAMISGSVLILVVGESPGRIYGMLIRGTWGDAYGFGQVIFKSTPLIFTGLAVALAFRAGLFNIGAEAQMVAGSLATAVIGASLPAGTPSMIAIPLCIMAGILGGAVIGAIPGALKAYYGAHEVINTIMFNFITSGVVLWLGNEFFFLRETTRSAQIAEGARLSTFGFRGSAANMSFILAIGAAVLVHFFLTRTRRGFEWRAVGFNLRAAENGGVSVSAAIIGAMAVSGGLAGAVGTNYVMGYKHYFEEGLGRGVGFMGIAVALLGRNHPLGIIGAALLFGTLSHGGLAISERVPKELIDVLQAIIILAVAATAAYMRYHWRIEEPADKKSQDKAGTSGSAVPLKEGDHE